MTDRADLEASLAEMDRKLRELQRELALVSQPGTAGEAGGPQPAAQPPPPPQPPPAPEPAAPPTPSPGAEAIEQAAARVAELGRRIDELAELRDELDRATRALQEEHRAAAAAPALQPAPGGDIVVNAGPFADISTLGAFEHALRRADGVADALVRSFEGNRAIVDVRLERPIDLASQLTAVLPFAFDVDAVGRGELTLTLRQPGA